MEKNKVSARNLIYFYFLLWHSFTWNWRKNGGFIYDFIWHQKWNWLMVSWVKSGIKLWNRQIRSGKKNETDGTRLRRGRQFHFFSRPNLDGFIILATLTHETTASFIFEPKKRKKASIFRQFHVKRTTKKKMRFPAKTLWNWRFCFLLFWLKNETGCGFMIFKGLKLWNRPKSVGKKMKLTAAAEGNFWKLLEGAQRPRAIFKNFPLPRAVSFIFFPTDSGGFIILCPLKWWNRQPVSFLMPK